MKQRKRIWRCSDCFWQEILKFDVPFWRGKLSFMIGRKNPKTFFIDFIYVKSGALLQQEEMRRIWDTVFQKHRKPKPSSFYNMDFWERHLQENEIFNREISVDFCSVILLHLMTKKNIHGFVGVLPWLSSLPILLLHCINTSTEPHIALLFLFIYHKLKKKKLFHFCSQPFILLHFLINPIR